MQHHYKGIKLVESCGVHARVSPTLTMPNSIQSNQSQPTEQQKRSYANATQKEVFPTKDQAIVLESIEGIPINDYILALGKIIDPSHIRFASKISMNRVCIYLSSKEIVQKVTDQKTSISLGNNILTIKPLLTKYKRLILSNVCPVIPHNVLEDELKKHDIRLGSATSFLRAGVSEPGFSHVMSFRRQIYIHPEDVSKVPPSIRINYEDTVYWIYPSTDMISCFLCKQLGHLAKNCDNNVHKTNELEAEQHTILNKNIPNYNTIPEQSFPALKNPVGTVNPSLETSKKTKHEEKFPRNTTKRTLSLTTSSAEENPAENSPGCPENNIITKTRNKKQKQTVPAPSDCASLDPLDNQLQPLKSLLTSENNPYILNYNQLKTFLERAKGKSDLHELTLEFTENIPALISLLKATYQRLTERKIKSNFTRIINKLSIGINKESESDASFSSGDETTPPTSILQKINTASHTS